MYFNFISIVISSNHWGSSSKKKTLSATEGILIKWGTMCQEKLPAKQTDLKISYTKQTIHLKLTWNLVDWVCLGISILIFPIIFLANQPLFVACIWAKNNL